MIYTNGKIVISKNNDSEELSQALSRVHTYMSEELGQEVNFVVTHELGFPSAALPEEVDFTILEHVLNPYIALKAINEDSIVLEKEQRIEYKHIYDEKELSEIADDLTKAMRNKKSVELQKAASTKSFNTLIAEHDTEINTLLNNHTQGYEFKEVVSKVTLNFTDGKKYFFDVNTDRLVKTEDLKSSDKQLRIDHNPTPAADEAGEGGEGDDQLSEAAQQALQDVGDGTGKKEEKEEEEDDEGDGSDDLPM